MQGIRRPLLAAMALIGVWVSPEYLWAQGQLYNTNITLAGTLNAGTTTGAVNVYALALNPPITAYVTNQCFHFKAHATNSSAATLNINGLGAKVLKKVVGGVLTDMAAGDITTGQLLHVCYDGATMQQVGGTGGPGSGSALTVQEIDGSPSGTFTTLKFSNGAVTNNGDGSATIITGSGGGGDASTNTATSVDGEVALFSGAGGKTFKRATATGLSKLTAGVQSAAVAGTDYVLPGGNVATATALAANGANCPAGQFPQGVDQSGVVEGCTALPTTITGTPNEVVASAATGTVTLSLASVVNFSTKTLRVPNSTTLPPTCVVGDAYMKTNATSGGRWYLCEVSNTWTVQGGTGAPGGPGETPFGQASSAALVMANFGGL